MKTLTRITYIQELGRNQRMERTESFVRPYRATKPTYAGAARMVAARINAEDDTATSTVKPSDISVARIEFNLYQTR
jgi:hypothetical protein